MQISWLTASEAVASRAENSAMPPTRPGDLEAFVHRLDSSTLASVLLDLAQENEAVRQRLVRLRLANQPDRLAAAFKKTLAGWRRASRFFGYAEAREFGQSLEAWLGQIEHELMPKHPAAALELAEAFIESDAKFFERADDSDGCIGDAVRAGCRLWLRAAASCEAPANEWPSRLARLAAADEYGAREELLSRADLLLDEAALRKVVAVFEQQMRDALARSPEASRVPAEAFQASGALLLLAKALRDPDVHVRAVLSYSPQPNPNQKESFVRAYLEHDRAVDALPWLQGSWQHMEGTRERLEAEALRRLGRREDSARIRQRLFEESLAVGDLHEWLEDLPIQLQPQALKRARRLAVEHDDPVTSALLLLDIDEDAAAESALLAQPGRIRGGDYGSLVPLVKTLEARQRWAAATAVYRALLSAILERAYARAYGHAARYWERLQAIAGQCVDLAPLDSHSVFEAWLRSRHARKPSFWQHVNGTRRAVPAQDDQVDSL